MGVLTELYDELHAINAMTIDSLKHPMLWKRVDEVFEKYFDEEKGRLTRWGFDRFHDIMHRKISTAKTTLKVNALENIEESLANCFYSIKSVKSYLPYLYVIQMRKSAEKMIEDFKGELMLIKRQDLIDIEKI